MIPIIRFNEFLLELQAEVNTLLSKYAFIFRNNMWVYTEDEDAILGNDKGKQIDTIIISPTESHLIKKIKEATGIVLAVQLAQSDTEAESVDNYSENDNELFFILEKVDPAQFTEQNEQYHYAKLQLVIKLVKEYILSRGMNGNMCGGDETISKPFHTEWEYSIFGGFNGLSISFNLRNFNL